VKHCIHSFKPHTQCLTTYDQTSGEHSTGQLKQKMSHKQVFDSSPSSS